MEIKIENWRDRNGNDLDKAKRILSDSNIKTKEIADTTNISRFSIGNYRNGKTNIEQASWTIVNKLAQMYDVLELSSYIGDGGENIIKFSRALSEFFDETKEVYKDDSNFLEMVNILENMVSSDPKMAIELMKPFMKEEE